MDIREIMHCIPHRYPLLLLDRVVELEAGKRIVALKNVSINEPFFAGHFPGAPIMPGVLIVESMAQAGAVLMLHEMEDRKSKLIYFTGIDRARFRRTVVPGDQLVMTLEVLRCRRQTCKMKATATVDGQLAAEAEILSAMVSRD